MKLTNEQWGMLEPFFPKENLNRSKGGRPGYSNREILQGVLWVIRA
ncbi:transposase [bacterium]|nr:transposase [bacterium]